MTDNNTFGVEKVKGKNKAMADDVISRDEHNEFVKRIEENSRRVDKRLELLEQSSKEMTDIALSVRELATSVKTMAETQEKQGDKLEELESRDGDMWRKVVSYLVTAIVGILIGFIFKQMGIV